MPSTPAYRRIADEIRDLISRGDLQPGDQLPTEQELQEQHQAGRQTIRKAVDQLESQGLVDRHRRLGTFVREQFQLVYHATIAEQADRERTGEARDAFFDEVTKQGREPSQEFTMHAEPAKADVAARLGVAEDDLVVVRACFRYVDYQPWSDQVSFYALDVSKAAGLMTPHDIPEGTVRAMAAAGYEEIGKRDELSARMPTPEEARELDIRPGVPVVLYYRTTYNKERALRVTRTVFPADRTTVVYEWGDLVAYYSGLRIPVQQDLVR